MEEIAPEGISGPPPPPPLAPPLRAQHPDDDPRLFFASMYARASAMHTQGKHAPAMVLTPGAAAAGYSSGEGALIVVDEDGRAIVASAAAAEGPQSALGAGAYAAAMQQWLPHERVRSGLLSLPLGIGATALAGAAALRAAIDARNQGSGEAGREGSSAPTAAAAVTSGKEAERHPKHVRMQDSSEGEAGSPVGQQNSPPTMEAVPSPPPAPKPAPAAAEGAVSNQASAAGRTKILDGKEEDEEYSNDDDAEADKEEEEDKGEGEEGEDGGSVSSDDEPETAAAAKAAFKEQMLR